MLVLVWSVVHLTMRRAGTQPEAYMSCSSRSPPSCWESMTRRDLSPHGLFRSSCVSSAVLSHLDLAAYPFKRAKRAAAPHAACESNPASTTTRALAGSTQKLGGSNTARGEYCCSCGWAMRRRIPQGSLRLPACTTPQASEQGTRALPSPPSACFASIKN